MKRLVALLLVLLTLTLMVGSASAKATGTIVWQHGKTLKVK